MGRAWKGGVGCYTALLQMQSQEKVVRHALARKGTGVGKHRGVKKHRTPNGVGGGEEGRREVASPPRSKGSRLGLVVVVFLYMGKTPRRAPTTCQEEEVVQRRLSRKLS